MNLDHIKKLITSADIFWSNHCLERMGERDISMEDVSKCVLDGEIIEDYPDDYPHPSCLIFGLKKDGKFLHVVVGCDEKVVYIITAYTPSNDKFEADGKTRKENK